MTDLSTTDVHSRTVTAFFDSREAAQKATDDLVAAGVPRVHIRMTEGASGAASSVTSTPTPSADKGFWDELKDLFLPDEDRHGYAEGLRRGGYLLSVRVEESYYTRAMDILDTDGAVNMDEREADWRSSGWSGYSAGTATGTRTSAVAADMGVAAGLRREPQPIAPAPRSSTPTVDTLQASRDESIKIYEETAQVAKRETNHGRVRLRSYVVETPFSQEVNLRNETVKIERRPVDRVIAAGDAVFQDRVIEAEEHAEEAFITKETRIKEEIGLSKTVSNQAQTVSDTVRHTEVQVDDERAGRALGAVGTGGVAGGFASRIVEHMDVIASDGVKIGTVDHMEGTDRIKLAKSTSPDGQHHIVPLSWVDHVDSHVHLNRSLAEIKAGQ